MTLAIVDDDVDVRKALSRLLRSFGHDVQEFASAEDFEVRQSSVDCLILDVRLPGMTGPELRDRMRASGGAPPIVFVTGDGDRYLAEGAASNTAALHKPFDEARLLAAIEQAIAACRE